MDFIYTILWNASFSSLRYYWLKAHDKGWWLSLYFSCKMDLIYRWLLAHHTNAPPPHEHRYTRIRKHANTHTHTYTHIYAHVNTHSHRRTPTPRHTHTRQDKHTRQHIRILSHPPPPSPRRTHRQTATDRQTDRQTGRQTRTHARTHAHAHAPINKYSKTWLKRTCSKADTWLKWTHTFGPGRFLYVFTFKNLSKADTVKRTPS